MRVSEWLDHRTGYRKLVRAALDERVPGGASFAYIFGSVLLVTLLLQAATGVLLALYYSPSATDAWASVAYLQDQLDFGWFIRGLHSYGASAIVILSGLHMLQTAVWGAYKKPRELNWIIGVLMLGVILAFALTGYLLPWDQKGYWATKVATGIAGTGPIIGEALQQGVQGGNEYGNLTLTRFYAIHVLLLPAALVVLVVVHLYLFRRHGVTSHWWLDERKLRDRQTRFWPEQVLKDTIGVAVAFAVLIGLNIYTHGVELGAPADPASNFDARPEWYFRALFQALKYFEGSMETVVALGIPPVVGGLLLALPFMDRGPSNRPRDRALYLALLAAVAVAAGALTVVSYAEDAGDVELQQRLVAAHERAEEARALAAANGVPAAGGPSVFTTAPHHAAKQIWQRDCAGCHAGAKRSAPEIGPGYNSRTWIHNFLLDPRGDLFFGRTADASMPPTSLRGEELAAVVEAIYGETGAADADAALAERGRELFDDGDCSGCHTIEEVAEGDVGPNLFRRGSVEALASVIGHAASERWFGEDTTMPSFRDEYDLATRTEIAEWLWSLRSQPYPHARAVPSPAQDRNEGESVEERSEP